jgi:GntR family transcriptional repressor for pyruvate dehydrogenase complex
MLKPIKPKRISDQVFEQLRDLIFRGHLKPGEQFMTERVREAINKLVAMGLVEHRQGQGTYVKSPADKSAEGSLAAIMGGADVSLEDLLEVRLGLECNAVALAARRADEEDIRELEKSLGEMAGAIREGGLGSQADVSFHMAIAYATKNPVQVHIMRSFYDLLFYGIKQNLEHLYTEPQNTEIILRQHTRIVEAIRNHDPDGAFDAMRQHITYVLEFFKTRTGN